MGFVVGYAPCGLSPQTDGMPVIPENGAAAAAPLPPYRGSPTFLFRLDKKVFFLFFCVVYSAASLLSPILSVPFFLSLRNIVRAITAIIATAIPKVKIIGYAALP